jgi:hypothetical protein
MSVDRPTEAWDEAGFEFDEGDASVGIPSGWVHWCNANTVESGEPSIDISEGFAFLHYVGAGANRKQVGDKSLVCNTCGANFTWIEADWDPEYVEAPEEVERLF